MTTNGTEEQPLPSGWTWTQLGQVCTVNGGYAFKSRDYQDEGIPLLRISNINDKDVTFDEKTVYLSKSFASELSDYLLNSGDIVIALSGATTGKYGVFNYPGQALLNQRVGRLKFDDPSTITSKYIFYYMEVIRKDILEEAYGAAQPNISTRKLAEFDVPLAPLPEQERIVAEIEKQFTRLDQAVASLRRLQSNLARYKASVLKAACEGRLVPQDPANEPADQLLARILAERRAQWQAQEWQNQIERAQKKAAQARRKANGRSARSSDLKPEEWQDIPESEYAGYLPKNDKWKKKYKEPEGVETAEPPELPESWEWVRTEQVCDPIANGTTPRGRRITQDPTGIPFIKVSNLTFDGSLDFTEKATFFEDAEYKDSTNRSRVKPGDVLINIVGLPFGQASIVPATYSEWIINQNITVFSPITKDLNSKFLSYVFLAPSYTQRDIVTRATATAGQYYINLTTCRSGVIPLPPSAEQERIVAEVERRLSIVAAIEQTITANLSRAERLRQSILHRAFTGQLVPQEEVASHAS